MDLKKLTPGEMVISVSGIVLLIFSFFKWYGGGGGSVDVGGGNSIDVGSFSFNGWQAPSAFLSVVAILLGVVMAAHVITDKVAGVEMPERIGKVGWGVFYLAGGSIAFLFVLIKWLGNTSGTKIGIYVGLLSTAGLAAGGFLVAKERGHLDELTGGGAGAPPAPPAA
ncbi:MAG: hypothetical protein MUP67_12500 [Acidimicrobiia bacterium]|nr:hypothetical protein [Acidimicrobiia bacterium]